MPLVVIVDDGATNRQLYSKLACSIDPAITVRSFEDGVSAIAWLKDNTPDLVLTDYNMPVVNGAELIRRFRAIPGCSEVPVIVVTAYDDRGYRIRALEAGATDFLTSPVDHQEFITRSRNLLTLRSQHIRLARRAKRLESELKRSELSRELATRESAERLAQVIDTIPSLVSAADENGKIIFVNALQARLVGVDPNQVVGEDVESLFGNERGRRSKVLDQKVISTGSALPSYEEEIRQPNGNTRVWLTTKSPLKNCSKEIIGVLTSSLDISDRKNAEAHVLHLATHDSLTGLPNRMMLADTLRCEIARTRRGDRRFALHMIDLDSFKEINDGLGHASGDKYLKEVSRRLQAVVGQEFVARLGGDEFAIVQSHFKTHSDAASMASQVLAALQAPWPCADGRIMGNASIGVAVHPEDGMNEEELLRSSDLAMYRAKNEGGGTFRYYAADLDRRSQDGLALDAALRKALERNEFVLHYQPQVSLATGEVVGAEALLRWERDGFLLNPSEFLPRAEQNGLITQITEWALEQACAAAKAWLDKGYPIRAAVNVSSVSFLNNTLPLFVARVLAKTGLAPWFLELELTESVILHSKEEVAKQLQQLKEIGVSISIDDFGTRYSTFSYVKEFPADRLKIDHCFIKRVDTSPSDAAIVRAIVSLGHSLGMSIIAEGAESDAQVKLLRDERVDEVQGYYFSAPLPAAAIVHYFESATLAQRAVNQ
jgi:diguanylate cyclase (GGDEF)-like protein/PAS domain S-box-containing protein